MGFVRIDVWTDIICPFCTVGKAELDRALASFPHADEVTVVPRSFELHPGATVEPTTTYLERKYGWTPAQLAAQCDAIDARARAVGLRYHWRPSINAPTRDAHRLVKLAATVGLAREAEDAFALAYFTDAADVSDHGVLRERAASVGLDAVRVEQVLASDEFADAVASDTAEAKALGITGTPFFLIEGKYGVSGAQTAEAFGRALAQVWAESHPVVPLLDLGLGGASGPACGPDGCA